MVNDGKTVFDSQDGKVLNRKRNMHTVHFFGGATVSYTMIIQKTTGVCRSFIPNKTTFMKYCLTQKSQLPGSFEFHWVRQNLVNFTGLAVIVNANFPWSSQFSQVADMANCPNFYCNMHCRVLMTVKIKSKGKVMAIDTENRITFIIARYICCQTH